MIPKSPHPNMQKLIIILICFNIIGHCHEKIIIDIGQKHIQGVINKQIQIDLSSYVDKIREVSTVDPLDSKYLSVHHASVFPVPSRMGFAKNFIALPSNSLSLLQELRTYQSSHYKDIVIAGSYIFLHLIPNKIIVVKQKTDNSVGIFSLQNTYALDDLQSRNETKMYKIKDQNSVLLVIKNSHIAYRLRVSQSHKFTMDFKLQATHIQFITSNIFVAAQQSKGMNFYQLTNDMIKVSKLYDCQSLNITNQLKANEIKQSIQQQAECFISDLFYNQTNSNIYMLDSQSNVYDMQIKIMQGKVQLQNKKIVSQAKGCNSMDIISSDHLVLLCFVDMPNPYIQQIIRIRDPKDINKQVYVKKNPIYHNCRLKDLIVTYDYFLTFDTYTIDVFWNNLQYGQLTAQHSKQHFNMPGLQTFAIKPIKNNKDKIYLYVVQSNVLLKYELDIFPGKVFVHSLVPVNKIIKLRVPGRCKDPKYIGLTAEMQINTNTECLYELKVQMNILQKQQKISQQKMSMSMGAIVIMLAVILILTWICLAKYRGLENHARKVLQKYRQSSRPDQNKLSI